MTDRRARINHIYDCHPLSAESILRRLQVTGRGNDNLTEDDLAYDPVYGVTDQNHIGGAQSVLAMGVSLGLCKGARVLDLGSGLGGPARLLAQSFGVVVTGVDVNEGRYKDARLLTELTKTEGTTFERGDFFDRDVTFNSTDVLWGQGTWSHIRSKERFLAKWHPALSRDGQLACEDVFLRSDARGHRERVLLEDLKRIWQVEFSPGTSWLRAFSAAGFRVVAYDDLSEEMEGYCRDLAAKTRRWPEWPESESIGLEIAAALAAAGILGCFRAIARKTKES